MTPVYPTTAQLPQAYLRKAVASALAHADLREVLPADAVPPGLPALRDALQMLHQPPPDAGAALLEDREHPAWQRLKFEELLAQQLSQLQAKRERERQRAPAFALRAGGLQEVLLAALPFALTNAQRRVGAEIAADLGRAVPMHRLLQGDVGSGKTVVAALAASIAIDAGWQCALMAPTEILAEQHLRKLVGWLAPLGVQVAWLTGSRKGKGAQRDARTGRVGRSRPRRRHPCGDPGPGRVRAPRLGHRRRAAPLRGAAAARAAQQAGRCERSGRQRRARAAHLDDERDADPAHLAMTLFADLDISTLDELPPGRTPIVTKLFADAKRDAVIERIRDEVGHGRQVYWVCPLIEESETLDLQNATEAHRQLSDALPGRIVGLLHGRMPAAEKSAVMALFTAGQMAVLVSTTVIEVGVDVPNASLMVIEHAERFGLSQLHQLRGRIGRGSVASVCVLLYSAPLSPTAKARLKTMLETQDGFEIARRDLEIRGPGEFLGARQSGAALLRFADLARDNALAEAARQSALHLLDRDPAAAAAHLARWHGGKAEYLKA
jgi:ATP-dependent DNA helicase RecG